MSEDTVRVRYAPSPTGMQHIGGVRTALFNYLFARSMGGKFILRLEDTDRTRFDKRFVDNLYETMAWLHLEWDEGGDKGGEYGPYVQSERFELYKKYAYELLEKKAAYFCFCDSERLERIRKIKSQNKMPPGYDRACRELDEDEVRHNLEAGKPFVIRLKVPLDGVTVFNDLILGKIEWKNADVSPDPILLKSDGFPTYHLANIVDDHLMKITHVMRAQEWIPSTPLHVLMYEAFGWKPPIFCHLPMVNGQDGQKLSKRHGATSVNEFRARGYLPEALVNYVAMLGCSYVEGQDIYTLEEMAKHFRTDKLNKSPAVFDYKKLEWYNGQYIRTLTDEELLERVLPFLTGKGDAALPVNVSAEHPLPHVGTEFSGLAEDENGELYCVDKNVSFTKESLHESLISMMALIKERLKYLADAPEMVGFAFKEISAPAKEALIPKRLDAEKTREVLVCGKSFIHTACSLPHDEAEETAKEEAAKLEIKLGDFMMSLRMALTGSRISPPLIGSIKILGEERCLSRLEKAIKVLED